MIPALQDLVASGRIVDVILALVLVEATILLAWRRIRGTGIPASRLIPNTLAGVSLLLALRAALVGPAWPWVPAFLFCALLAHIWDLRTQW